MRPSSALRLYCPGNALIIFRRDASKSSNVDLEENNKRLTDWFISFLLRQLKGRLRYRLDCSWVSQRSHFIATLILCRRVGLSQMRGWPCKWAEAYLALDFFGSFLCQDKKNIIFISNCSWTLARQVRHQSWLALHPPANGCAILILSFPGRKETAFVSRKRRNA